MVSSQLSLDPSVTTTHAQVTCTLFHCLANSVGQTAAHPSSVRISPPNRAFARFIEPTTFTGPSTPPNKRVGKPAGFGSI